MNDESMVKSVCMDADDIERAVTRMAHQILEANKGADNIALVGIVTRGDLLAKMLVHKIEEIEGVKVPLGKLDISFYRDDFATHMSPEVHSTDIPFSIDGMTIVLVDDVLYTGRTIRAALDALMDIGRPAAVELAVLVDRGHRRSHLRLKGVPRVSLLAKSTSIPTACSVLSHFLTVSSGTPSAPAVASLVLRSMSTKRRVR